MSGIWSAYRQRWMRRRLLWRAFRKRRELKPVADRSRSIAPDQVLAFATVRNEAQRLPFFLEHYRKIGVGHFLIVDNGSTDGGTAYLADQPDVSLWETAGSYRDARFGASWLGWLQARYGHGRWCLTVDADEILIYPHWPDCPLPELCRRLEVSGARAFGALMIDLFPLGRLGEACANPGRDPFDVLGWFDPGPYRSRRCRPMQNLIVQGGARERVFFEEHPDLGPTLNKLPLVKWDRRYAYANAAHSLLPGELNLAYDGPGETRLCGVLLHSKFLPDSILRAKEDLGRRAHFGDPDAFVGYYEKLAGNPTLWSDRAIEYTGWRQLVDLGLMSAGN